VTVAPVGVATAVPRGRTRGRVVVVVCLDTGGRAGELEETTEQFDSATRRAAPIRARHPRRADVTRALLEA
jgi:hypothetical protein